MKFPIDLGSFLLKDYSMTDGKHFQDLDSTYLMVNKQINQKNNNRYHVSLTYCFEEYIAFQSFISADIYEASEDFDVDVILDGQTKEINCNIVSPIDISFNQNRAFIKFNIVENFILI